MGGSYIQRIIKHKLHNGEVIFEVLMSDGRIHVQSIERISRFWRGKNYALERLYNQYVPEWSKTRSFLDQNRPTEIIDVGGNIGEFALSCAKEFPNSRIFVFEPDPIVFECLQRNIEDAKLQARVIPIQTALSSSNSPQDFYIATESADSSLVRPEKHFRSIRVVTRRLEDFLQDEKIRTIGLLKMDAEGFEPEVLMGMGKMIVQCKAFAIDVSPERNGLDTEEEVIDLLNPLGFNIEHATGQGKRKFVLAFLSNRQN